jgi:hypothetical protein
LSNTGQAQADGVTLAASSPAVSPAGALTLQSTSGINNTALTGGGSKQFTYVYQAALAGTAAVSASSVGTDHNTGSPLASAVGVANVTVQTVPALSGTLTAAPLSVLQGGLFTVTLTVSNSGQATASNVSPVAALVSSDGSVTQVLTATGAVSLAAGASHSWSWTMSGTAVSVAPVSFSASVLSQDQNTGGTLAALPLGSNTVTVVNTNPLLTASFVSVLPAVQTVNQQVTAILHVTNSNGLVGATNVNVISTGLTPVTMTGSLVGGLPATVASLAPGGSTDFTFRYLVTAAGGANLTATAQASAGAAAFATSASFTVQSGLSLTVKSMSLTPLTASVGQAFTLLVTV